MTLLHPNWVPLHTCTACGRTATWGPTWSWYGSMADADEGRPLVKACCDECRRTIERQGMAK